MEPNNPYANNQMYGITDYMQGRTTSGGSLGQVFGVQTSPKKRNANEVLSDKLEQANKEKEKLLSVLKHTEQDIKNIEEAIDIADSYTACNRFVALLKKIGVIHD